MAEDLLYREITVQKCNKTEDGTWFVTDMEDYLHRCKLGGEFHAGDVVKCWGLWKQGKRKYFDIVSLGEEKPAQTSTLASGTASYQDGKNKSYALAYSKDLVCESIEHGKPVMMSHFRTVIKGAQLFEAFLDGKMEIGDADLVKLIAEMNKPEIKEKGE